MKTLVKVEAADNKLCNIRTLLAGDIVQWGTVPGDRKLWRVKLYFKRIIKPETGQSAWRYCSAEAASHVEITEHYGSNSKRIGAGWARVPVSTCEYVRQAKCPDKLLKEFRDYAEDLGRQGMLLLSLDGIRGLIGYPSAGNQLG